jgi:hypothetical protein
VIRYDSVTVSRSKIPSFAIAGAVAVAVALSFAGSLRAQVRSLPDRVGEAATTSIVFQGKEIPRASDAFVDSVGVNVHLHFFDTNYVKQYDDLRSLLIASHIRHIRDGLIDTTWSGYYDHLNDLAAHGIRADLITAVTQTPVILQAYPARVHPGTIEAIEAPNEYNTSSNTDWAPDLVAFQKMLYQTVRTSAGYRGVTVIGPSLTKPEAYAAVGDLSAFLDTGNSHPYPAGHEPATHGFGLGGLSDYGSLDWNLRAARVTSGSKPMYVTETGYGDTDAVPEGVADAVKERYILRLFLEAWNAGVARTYIYQFLDAGNDGFGSYGIVDSAMHPKPAYTALQNLLAALNDPGATFPLTPLAYTLSGPARLHHTLLERRDGSYALVLWLAVPSWEVGTHRAIAVKAVPVTIAFPNAAHRIDTTVFDDAGNTATHGDGSQRTFVLPISDNVTIIHLN